MENYVLQVFPLDTSFRILFLYKVTDCFCYSSLAIHAHPAQGKPLQVSTKYLNGKEGSVIVVLHES